MIIYFFYSTTCNQHNIRTASNPKIDISVCELTQSTNSGADYINNYDDSKYIIIVIVIVIVIIK